MKDISFFQLYKLIRKNENLAVKRHPLIEQNKFMKVFVYIFAGFWAVYLMFFGFTIAQITDLNYEIFDILNGSFIFFLLLDFLSRLSFQETPAQRVKPYKLLPIKLQSAIDVFQIRTILSSYNLFWLFFWIPFSLFTVLRFFGVTGFLFYNICIVLLYSTNGLWFLIWRTLCRGNSFLYIIPIAIYGILVYWGIFSEIGNEWLYHICMKFGRMVCECNFIAPLIIILCMSILFFINRKIQFHSVYNEISAVEKAVTIKKNEMTWLNSFGIVGEYLKLEIKSIKRNKVVKKQFMTGLFVVLLFSVLFAFTDVYDNSVFMECFICVYCFACLGTITLTNIMCPEGNYMDFLMSRSESVLSLLKAKYFFNCIMLFIPFIFALMPVIKGKFIFLEIIGAMFFVSGCVFPFLFQQAVYNNQTMPLNEQLTVKAQNSKSQFIVSMVALFLPMIIMSVLFGLFNRETASLILFILGLTGTFLYPLWIKNIYKRFMKRRYVNMDGFRNTKV